MSARGTAPGAGPGTEAQAAGGRTGARRAGRLLLVAGAAILFALFPYVPGLVGAAVLYVVGAPLHRRLAPLLGARASAAALALGTFFVMLVPGTWLVSTGIHEAAEALRAFQRSDLLGRLADSRLAGVDVRQQVQGAEAALLAWLSGRAVSLFGSATRGTLNAAIALLGMYYLLAGALPWARLRRVLALPPSIADALGTRFVQVTEAMLVGTLLTAVAQGTLVGVAFSLVGLRGAVLWGLVTACMSVLPVLGSAFVWLPGAAVLAMDHRYGAAVFVLVTGAGVISNIDNLILLVVYRRISGIHPMVTLVGALGGVEMFGLAGVIIGPLVLSYFAELLRVYEEQAGPRPAGAPAPAAAPSGDGPGQPRGRTQPPAAGRGTR